ncbi:MAG: hypothetical protein ACYTFM_12715 [Planctomycetota bacterium]|jgi:hypothetical protein
MMDENESRPEEQKEEFEKEKEEVRQAPKDETIEAKPTFQDPKLSHEVPMTPNHVLPPRRYKLKVLLMLSDLFALIVFVYFFMIRSVVRDVCNDTFSFISNRMFSFYCVLAITVGLIIFIFIFKTTSGLDFWRSNGREGHTGIDGRDRDSIRRVEHCGCDIQVKAGSAGNYAFGDSYFVSCIAAAWTKYVFEFLQEFSSPGGEH